MSEGGPSQRFFDVWSRVYDAPLVQRLVYRPVQDAIVRALDDTAKSGRWTSQSDAKRPDFVVRRILDVGCGTGLLTARMAAERSDAAVVGLDFSFGMLEQAVAARGRDRGPAWVQGDAMRLPFADGTFGAITCTESFHWYPDQPAALAEFARVLQPGGAALVALINTRTRTASKVGEAASQLAGQPARWPSRTEMRSMVEGAGLIVEQQRAVLRPPVPIVLSAVLTVGRKPV